jgi:diguanylate cyclase (GGDEF)-like protein
MLDIDHFKRVNDIYGNAMGDVVITALVSLLGQRLHQSDLIERYRGEEFAVVQPDCDA